MDDKAKIPSAGRQATGTPHGDGGPHDIIPSALAAASNALVRASEDLSREPVSASRRLFWRALLAGPRAMLALSYRAHQAVDRILRIMGRARRPAEGQTALARPEAAAPDAAVSCASAKLPRRTISALICNYNHARYLPRAMEAVIGQTRPVDELLIMDDGSTDDSFAIMTRYAAQYPWIKVFRKNNEGYIKGISDLTQRAEGDFIHRGTSDDFMLPNFVAAMMEQAEKFPQVGIVSGELSNASEASSDTMHLEIPGWATGYKSPNQFLHGYLEQSDPCMTLAPSTIFRRAVIAELGGWREELDTWDVSFLLQAAALKYGMAYVDTPVYTWVYREGGWTHATNRDKGRVTKICLRYFELMISPEYKVLFGTKFPEQWLHANLRLSGVL